MKQIVLEITKLLYKTVFRPLFFLIDPEKVHTRTTALGQKLGQCKFAKKTFALIFCQKHPRLEQTLFGLEFKSPAGLAAGFDYEAKLTQILPSLGFGFGTVGTLTNHPYDGNPRPILGRLPKSKSLLVNKGFKNLGIETTLNNLRDLVFSYPVGVSIGQTNSTGLVTLEQAVADIQIAFVKAEKSQIPFSYYELNISCPNLSSIVDFYHPERLAQLLKTLAKLNLSRPVWLKMPISKTDQEIGAMMERVLRYPFIQAAIFGNLQRDRNHPVFDQSEVRRFVSGNFSGMPCQKRSDELVRFAYQNFGTNIKIIGCGGIFSAKDAYRKIKLGASLIQLITGLVYEGPQLVAQINRELEDLLKKDGFSHLSQAIGSQSKL